MDSCMSHSMACFFILEQNAQVKYAWPIHSLWSICSLRRSSWLLKYVMLMFGSTNYKGTQRFQYKHSKTTTAKWSKKKPFDMLLHLTKCRLNMPKTNGYYHWTSWLQTINGIHSRQNLNLKRAITDSSKNQFQRQQKLYWYFTYLQLFFKPISFTMASIVQPYNSWKNLKNNFQVYNKQL